MRGTCEEAAEPEKQVVESEDPGTVRKGRGGWGRRG